MTAVPASHRRGDVQGLRGIAVLLVIGLHWAAAPRGGYAGVDMFFVISGFVITAGLLREAEASGTVSLRSFYARRVRRIAPAALTTLAATVAAAVLFLPGARAAAVMTDAAWSAVAGQNVWLVVSGEARTATVMPPLAHFWSLAVEEQFYLVWPLLMLVAWRVGVRFGAPRLLLLAVAAAASLVSLGCGIWGSATDPQTAYFSTLARGWELGVGCVLALLVPHLARLPRWSRLLLSVGGIAGIGAGCLLFRLDGFPLPAALFPVAGTAALIAAGTRDGSMAVTGLLNRRALLRVGELSYSLYLWHLPVYVFLVSMQPGVGLVAAVLEATAVTVPLAVLSYRFVEQPLLSRWWSPRRSRSTVSPVSSPMPNPSTP